MSTLLPNMGLVVPTVGSEPGPDWATELNASLSILDSHNHSSGQGVQIQPSGLNINSDLSFSSNNAVSLKSARFTAQSTPLVSVSDVGCMYVVGNELYYNDVSGGHNIAITSNGSVNAGAGSIAGLPTGTASATYAAGTFVWQSATLTAANLDAASVVLRNSGASSNGLTLQAPNMAGGSTSVTLPAIPAAISFMQLDTSGNMSASVAVAGGLTQSNLGALSVGTSQLIDASVTQAKRASLGQQISSGVSGSYNVPSSNTAVPGLSVTITTTGRPVFIGLISNGNMADLSVVSGSLSIILFRSGTQVGGGLVFASNSTTVFVPPSSFNHIDVPAAGTYSYSITARYDTVSAGSAAIESCKLVAYEL